jgi:iron complex outermembrane receptor protein
MSFSKYLKMIHCIFILNKKMQKSMFFFPLFFFAVFVLRKTQSGMECNQGGMPLPVTHIKTVSSDVSGNYLIKRLPSGNAKIFVSCIGFQSVDISGI